MSPGYRPEGMTQSFFFLLKGLDSLNEKTRCNGANPNSGTVRLLMHPQHCLLVLHLQLLALYKLDHILNYLGQIKALVTAEARLKEDQPWH